MRTKLDIITKLQPMLYAVGTSTYFTLIRIGAAIDDAYIAVSSARQWADIKKSFVLATSAGEDYYDYPDNCQTESIFRISVDGNSKYEKLDFEDFLRYREDNPSETRKIFSEYGRQIFIFPTPTTNGTANLIFWGIIQAAPLLNDSYVTMFSDWADYLNEAILQYAYADLVQNIDANKATAAIAKGDRIITQEYRKIADRMQRKLTDRVQFEVPDLFDTTTSGIGQFRVDK